MKVILYARASTRDKQNPEHQMAELIDWALGRGHEVVCSQTEHASGRRDDRPVWSDLLGRVLRGEADAIVATELSRFGRSTKHLLEVAHALAAHGRHLVCTRQPIDTTSPVGKLVFTILGAVAEFEVDLTRERVAAAVQQAKAKRGGAWGRQREQVPGAVLREAASMRAQLLPWRMVSALLARHGHVQPARAHGRSAHPARPWPVGTLRAALARVQLPPANQSSNPPPVAGSKLEE